MKLRRFCFAFVLTLTLCVAAAWGALPEKSVYAVLRLEDLGGLLRWGLSEGNLKAIAPAAELGDDDIQVITAALEKIPARDAALIAGVAEAENAKGQKEFLYLALSMPESLKEKTGLVAAGKAKAGDIAALLLGADSPVLAMADGMIQAAPQEGNIYVLNDTVALGAKDNILLFALTADEVRTALAAMEAGAKLDLNRRFATKDFALVHVDPDMMEALARAQIDSGDKDAPSEEDIKAIREIFKAPLNVEMGFESFPDRFLVSLGMNLKESFSEKYLETIEAKPVKGGHIRLLGKGSPILALGTLLNIKMLTQTPFWDETWKELLSLAKAVHLDEKTVAGFFEGGTSIVLGGDTVDVAPALLMGLSDKGLKAPCLYMTQEMSSETASVLSSRLPEEAARAHFNPVQAAGWSRMLQLDTSISPLPCLMGQEKNTFLLALFNAANLAEKPEPAPRLKALLERESVGSLYLDFAALQASVKNSGLPGLLPVAAMLTEIKELPDMVNGLLDAKLSVPSFSLWAPDFETLYMDFALADVPPEEGLWARLAKVYEVLNKDDEKEDK